MVSSEKVAFQDSGATDFTTEDSDAKTIYVVGHGWHTGIVVAQSDLAQDVFPEVDRFQHVDFLEFGWGDEGFYTAKKITPPLVAKAALLPTQSVIHLAGFKGSVESFFNSSDVVEVHLSPEQFDKMSRFMVNSLKRDSNGTSIFLREGLYGDSVFLRAKGKYHAANTCNVWTSKCLKNAGLPVISGTALTAESVLSQARRFGVERQKSVKGIKKAALGGSRDVNP